MATPEWPARWSRAAAGAVVDLGPRARFSGDLWVAGTAGKTHDKSGDWWEEKANRETNGTRVSLFTPRCGTEQSQNPSQSQNPKS